MIFKVFFSFRIIYFGVFLLQLTWILVEGVSVKCNFDEYSYPHKSFDERFEVPSERYYRCTLKNVGLPEDGDTEFYIDKAGYDNRANLSEMVWIEGSELKTIPAQIFTAFPNLSYLHIFQSEVEELESASFVKAKNLNKLRIRGVNITKINENVFSNAKSLEYLGLIEDEITNIDKDAFQGLDELKGLYLSGNLLTVPEKTLFNPLKNLEELFLDKNLVDTLPEGLFAENTKLKLLSLTGNQIAEIDPLLFENVTELGVVDFSGNECSNEIFNLTEIDIKTMKDKLEKCFASEESDGEDEDGDGEEEKEESELEEVPSEPAVMEARSEAEMDKVIESYNSFMYFLIPTMALLFVLLVMTFIAFYYYISVIKKITVVINDTNPS